MTPQPLLTLRDNIIKRHCDGSTVRIALTNGVMLNGKIYEVNADHLVMEDRKSKDTQMVAFESIATVGYNYAS